MQWLRRAEQSASRTPGVDVVAALAKGLLNLRLGVGFLTVLWLGIGHRDGTDAAALLTAMLLILGGVLCWGSVGRLLLTHPVALAGDALVTFALLHVLGADSPYAYAAIAGAAFCGLCLGKAGALVFTPVHLVGWYTVVMLGPPEAEAVVQLFGPLLVFPSLLVAALFGGVAVRGLVVRSARNERAMRDFTRQRALTEERARLAREMHDSVAKSLYGIALLADSLPDWFARDPARAREQSVTLARTAREAGQGARDLIAALRTDDSQVSFEEALGQRLERWADRTGRTSRLRVHGIAEPGPGARYETLAILDECLENIHRHTAGDDRVAVVVDDRDEWLTLTITDEGPGFRLPDDLDAFEEAGHYGLVGMRERARRVGGSLRVDSRPGDGTTVSLRVPAVPVEPDDASPDALLMTVDTHPSLERSEA